MSAPVSSATWGNVSQDKNGDSYGNREILSEASNKISTSSSNVFLSVQTTIYLNARYVEGKSVAPSEFLKNQINPRF